MGKTNKIAMMFGLGALFGLRTLPSRRTVPEKASRTAEDISERRAKQTAKLARRAARNRS